MIRVSDFGLMLSVTSIMIYVTSVDCLVFHLFTIQICAYCLTTINTWQQQQKRWLLLQNTKRVLTRWEWTLMRFWFDEGVQEEATNQLFWCEFGVILSNELWQLLLNWENLSLTHVKLWPVSSYLTTIKSIWWLLDSF